MDWQGVTMPEGAEILTVQIQNDVPYLWALVDPEARTEIRGIAMFGTGHPIDYDIGASGRYISTFQLRNGELVFHVFENLDKSQRARR